MFSPSPRPWSSGEYAPGEDPTSPQQHVSPIAEENMGTEVISYPKAGNPVLGALDHAKTQSYHFEAILIAGMGFFTDSYDLFVITLLTKLLGRIYYYDPSTPTPTPGILHVNALAAVNGVALCGTLAGQLFFGWAGDKWGRKKVYGITLILMIVASLGQGLSFGFTRNSVIATLCFFRFWLGFGIGGDYPLSATIMSEYSNTKTRGAFVAAVFAMQGIGYLFAAAVTIIITVIFNGGSTFVDVKPPNKADWVWRLILMFGAVPAALTYYSRSKMPETARYTALIERDERQAALDMERVLHTHLDTDSFAKNSSKAQPRGTEFGLLTRKFVRRHGKEFLGCCLSWFLLDISYYSQNLFQTQVFSAVGWVPPSSNMGALREVFVNAKYTALLALYSTVPGYWFTVFFIDRVGRKRIQLMGFFMMSVFMFILGIDFYTLRGHLKNDAGYSGPGQGGNHKAFIILYAFTFFFSNFGPNATTFVIPSELFPARLRSTCHGIASAIGKAGAIVGNFGFVYASQDDTHGLAPLKGYDNGIGYRNSFILLAVCAVMGFVITALCIPETKGRSLEDLSGESLDNNTVLDGGL